MAQNIRSHSPWTTMSVARQDAAPARQQAPDPCGPPPASHARRRKAPRIGAPAPRLHQGHRRRPAPCVRYPRPGSLLLRRGASHPRHRTPSAAPARPPRLPAPRGCSPPRTADWLARTTGQDLELDHTSCHRLLRPVHRYPDGGGRHRHQPRSGPGHPRASAAIIPLERGDLLGSTPPRVTSLRPLRLKGRPLAGYASDEGCAALATATAQYLLPR
jgi:hypothetical protein